MNVYRVTNLASSAAVLLAVPSRTDALHLAARVFQLEGGPEAAEVALTVETVVTDAVLDYPPGSHVLAVGLSATPSTAGLVAPAAHLAPAAAEGASGDGAAPGGP